MFSLMKYNDMNKYVSDLWSKIEKYIWKHIRRSRWLCVEGRMQDQKYCATIVEIVKMHLYPSLSVARDDMCCRELGVNYG